MIQIFSKLFFFFFFNHQEELIPLRFSVVFLILKAAVDVIKKNLELLYQVWWTSGYGGKGEREGGIFSALIMRITQGALYAAAC